jgi:hypothetical protein
LALAVGGVVVWAWAEIIVAANINVAASIDLMTTTLKSIDAGSIKHICYVDNSGRWVHHQSEGKLTTC